MTNKDIDVRDVFAKLSPVATYRSVNTETYEPTTTLLLNDNTVRRLTMVNGEPREFTPSIDPVAFMPKAIGTDDERLAQFIYTENVFNYLRSIGIDVEMTSDVIIKYNGSQIPLTTRMIREPIVDELKNELQGKKVFLYAMFVTQVVDSTLGLPKFGYKIRFAAV